MTPEAQSISEIVAGFGVFGILIWTIKKMLSGTETRMVAAINKIEIRLDKTDVKHEKLKDDISVRYALKDDTQREIDKLHTKASLQGETLAQIVERTRGIKN